MSGRGQAGLSVPKGCVHQCAVGKERWRAPALDTASIQIANKEFFGFPDQKTRPKKAERHKLHHLPFKELGRTEGFHRLLAPRDPMPIWKAQDTLLHWGMPLPCCQPLNRVMDCGSAMRSKVGRPDLPQKWLLPGEDGLGHGPTQEPAESCLLGSFLPGRKWSEVWGRTVAGLCLLLQPQDQSLHSS